MRNLRLVVVDWPQAGAQALLEGEHEAKPEAQEVVGEAVAKVPPRAGGRQLLNQAHLRQLLQVGAQGGVSGSQRGRQLRRLGFA
jgi:hypothetical protein